MPSDFVRSDAIRLLAIAGILDGPAAAEGSDIEVSLEARFLDVFGFFPGGDLSEHQS